MTTLSYFGQQHPTAVTPSRATETWRNGVPFATVGKIGSAAKADFTVALSCPHSSMAPVLAVAGMVADHHRFDGDSTPLESFINQSQPGRPDLFQYGEQKRPWERKNYR